MRRFFYGDTTGAVPRGVLLPGADAETELAYWRFARRGLYWGSRERAWIKLVRRAPTVTEAIDSASAVACLRGVARGVGPLSEEWIDGEAPYRLGAGVREFAEEMGAYGVVPGQRIADVGAGAGHVGHYLVYAGLEVTATERSFPIVGIRELRASMPPNVAARYRTAVATQKDPALEVGAYDVILLRKTFHHLRKPGKLLPKLAAALKPGGRVLLVERFTDRGTDPHQREELLADCRKYQPYAVHEAAFRAAGFERTREVALADGAYLSEWRLP